jgi:hypothetical protein
MPLESALAAYGYPILYLGTILEGETFFGGYETLSIIVYRRFRNFWAAVLGNLSSQKPPF